MCWSLFLIKLQGWHLFWRTSSNDCFCTALAPLTVTMELSVLLSPFLIITATNFNISDVCFRFKLKRLQRIRSSHQKCFIIKVILRYFTKFTGKQLYQSLFFNKVAEACNFIKKETLAKVFSCDFWKIFKNAFFTEHFRTTAS